MPGLQLGFGYERGALLRDEGDAFEATRDPRSYVPSACPGRRLPHTWVRDASGAAAGAPTVAPAGGRASLLDWVPLDRFLLLVGPDARPWLDAAAGLAGPPLAVRHLTHAEVPDLDAWLRIAGIAADGAILVRPDQHVAWRAPRAVDDPAAALGAALAASISGGA